MLGALAFAPIATAAGAAATLGAAAATVDPKWTALLADYRAKRAHWLDNCLIEDEASNVFREAEKRLPPKPVDPGSGLPDDLSNLTIADIRAAGQNPAHQAAVATYKRDLAIWQAQHDALYESIYGPPREFIRAAIQAQDDALVALVEHRAQSAAILAEKLSIMIAAFEDFDAPSEMLEQVLLDTQHLAKQVRA
ncbi:MAG: hypothetical protein PGN09_04205 [Sphingomonas fennica]